MVELALVEGKYFRGWSKQRLEKIRRSLLQAAAEVLASNSAQPALLHRTFVRNLFSVDGVNRRNTSFVSFNYDIMLDRTLIAAQKSIGDVDYGCYFRSFDIDYKDKRKRWDPPDPKKQLFLLKLHGSLNWTWCPMCSFMVVFPEENVTTTAMRNQETCTRCQGKLEPLIIPPAWIKSYKNPDIINIWEIGGFLFSQAKMIVFIGYSLPDADVQLRFLLRRALTQSKARPSVVVVSNHEASNDDPTYARYRRFFGKIDWRSTGFKTFAAQPEHGAS